MGFIVQQFFNQTPQPFYNCAWLIGLSIFLQFLMQGKVGGYASVFEKYQEKVESFM